MSDFFEKAENQRLLQKIELKQNSGMSIKKDTIQLIAAAFDSMTDEDWVEYERHATQSHHIYQKFYPSLSDIPVAAIRELVSKIPNIITELDQISAEDDEFLYHLCFSTIWAQIANYNDVGHLYDGDEPHDWPSEPENYNQWKTQLIKLCQDFLDTYNGDLLLNISFLLASVPYKKS